MDDDAGERGRERPRSASLPCGVTLLRSPGATRWARWSWRATGLVAGAPPGWRLLREEDGRAEFLAGGATLALHRAEIEAYRVSLAMTPPSVFAVLRRDEASPDRLKLHTITASAYEAQDYQDSGEEIVEPVPMPRTLERWVRDFCGPEAPEPFRKRRRGPVEPEAAALGRLGDPRVRDGGEIWRAPRPRGPEDVA